MFKILVEGLNKKTLTSLEISFKKEEVAFQNLASNEELVSKTTLEKPNVLILDFGLLDEKTLNFCLKLKKCSKIFLLLIVTLEQLETKQKIKKILETTDFILKPIKLKELETRLTKILQTLKKPLKIIEKKHIKLDINNYELKILGKIKKAAPKELELLYKLMLNENKLFTRAELLEKVWGYKFFGSTRTVDIHIKRLRLKLKEVSNFYTIETIWGVGYKFKIL